MTHRRYRRLCASPASPGLTADFSRLGGAVCTFSPLPSSQPSVPDAELAMLLRVVSLVGDDAGSTRLDEFFVSASSRFYSTY